MWWWITLYENKQQDEDITFSVTFTEQLTTTPLPCSLKRQKMALNTWAISPKFNNLLKLNLETCFKVVVVICLFVFYCIVWIFFGCFMSPI